MKFVIEEANFCPRVIYVPNEDVPQEILNKLYRISNKNGMIILEYDKITPKAWRAKETEAHEMASLLLLVYENLMSSLAGGFDIPEWTRNAKVYNHKSFNTQKLAADCDFYFVEEHHLDDHKNYIKPIFDNIDEFLQLLHQKLDKTSFSNSYSKPKYSRKTKGSIELKKAQKAPDLVKDFPPLSRS